MRRDALWRMLGGLGIALVMAATMLFAENGALVNMPCDWIWEHLGWLTWIQEGCLFL